MKQFWLLLFMLMFLAACSSDATPSREVLAGDVIYSNSFDDPSSWDGFGAPDTQFGIAEGVYNAISAGGGYISVTNNERHSNAIIEATATLVSGSEDSVYGITCRAQAANSNIGYYFLINGGGQFSIRVGDGGRVRLLTEWTSHPAIKRELNSNTLRAICIDDYLAFYVNDRFVGEATHDWLIEGNMGITINAPSGIGLATQYDDVTIREATFGVE